MKMMHVISMQGNQMHDTYEKRAKGLVRKGRAYVVEDDTICMIPLEKENKMEPLTKEELLVNMEKMLHHNEYMKMAMDAIEKIPCDMEKEQVELRTNAILNMVKEKEATNQKLIALWQQMYQE